MSDSAIRPLTPLSQQRQRVLDFVVSKGTFPTMREISDHMGWKGTTGASDVLRVLHGAGFLTRFRNPKGGSRPYWLWAVSDAGRSAALRPAEKEKGE